MIWNSTVWACRSRIWSCGSIAETLMRRRESDTSTKADIHERDDGYLHKCREVAQQAADYFGWTRVSCVRDGKLRSIEDIHEELYARVKSCLEEV